jgi:hypothetical protein
MNFLEYFVGILVFAGVGGWLVEASHMCGGLAVILLQGMRGK